MPAPSAAVFVLLIFVSFIICTESLSDATTSIRIGSRSSKLALTQAKKFETALIDNIARRKDDSQTLTTDIVNIDAAGDKGSKTPIQQLPLAVSGVDFTGALDAAVLNGSVDVAVHSLKDIPPASRWKVTNGREVLVIGAYLGPRETPLDVLITKDESVKSMQMLPQHARIGSASIRRQAQLKAIRPDLDVVNLRGNVDARLKALETGDIDALVLALAGLKRLGILDAESSTILHEPDVSEEKQRMKYYYNPIPIETMLPGVGQGIIAIVCRNDNTKVLSLLKGIDDWEARISSIAEREFLDTVQILSPWDGRPPTAGFMRPLDSSTWIFNGLLATPDGAQVLRVEDTLEDIRCNEKAAHNLGRRSGETLVKKAGKEFLDGYY